MQNVLKGLLKERLSNPDKHHGDLIDIVVGDLKSENSVADEKFIIDAIAALLFASFATISSTLTVAMKFLTDHPKVVERLTVRLFFCVNHIINHVVRVLYICFSAVKFEHLLL